MSRRSVKLKSIEFEYVPIAPPPGWQRPPVPWTPAQRRYRRWCRLRRCLGGLATGAAIFLFSAMFAGLFGWVIECINRHRSMPETAPVVKTVVKTDEPVHEVYELPGRSVPDSTKSASTSLVSIEGDDVAPLVFNLPTNCVIGHQLVIRSDGKRYVWVQAPGYIVLLTPEKPKRVFACVLSVPKAVWQMAD